MLIEKSIDELYYSPVLLLAFLRDFAKVMGIFMDEILLLIKIGESTVDLRKIFNERKINPQVGSIYAQPFVYNEKSTRKSISSNQPVLVENSIKFGSKAYSNWCIILPKLNNGSSISNEIEISSNGFNSFDDFLQKLPIFERFLSQGMRVIISGDCLHKNSENKPKIGSLKVIIGLFLLIAQNPNLFFWILNSHDIDYSMDIEDLIDNDLNYITCNKTIHEAIKKYIYSIMCKLPEIFISKDTIYFNRTLLGVPKDDGFSELILEKYRKQFELKKIIDSHDNEHGKDHNVGVHVIINNPVLQRPISIALGKEERGVYKVVDQEELHKELKNAYAKNISNGLDKYKIEAVNFFQQFIERVGAPPEHDSSTSSVDNSHFLSPTLL